MIGGSRAAKYAELGMFHKETLYISRDQFTALHTKLRELATKAAAPGSDVSLTADRLADLQDQIRSIEQRMTSIREEVLSL